MAFKDWFRRGWRNLTSTINVFKKNREKVAVDEILRVLAVDEASVIDLIDICSQMKKALDNDDYKN